ncbi:MAG: glycosyltransferase family 2 protein [Rhodospirillales bacterium]|nr:glycosyltransferase family 2 protein [Rhodospirillales bacterium]
MSAVDVVIPCYNYGRYLEGCVEAILRQAGVDVRVLIIDDASSDETPEIGARLAERDPRVTFRRHTKNCGHILTYNEGLLGWASAEYSLLISADDLLAPGALARATQLMDRHPDVGMTYGFAEYFSDPAHPASVEAPRSAESQVIPGRQFLQRCFEHGNAVSTPTAVVRTRVQQAVGGYSVELPHSGDMEMWMRFAIRGPIGVIRAVQAFYRWHGNNMSHKYRTARLRDMKEVEQAADCVIAAAAGCFSEIGAWRAAMHRRFAAEAFWIASTAFDIGDAETYRIALAYAEHTDPALRGAAIWWKLRTKALLGPTVWRTVRPTLDCLRGIRDRPNARWTPPRDGQTFGWWPADLAR